jgi:cytochrome P450
VTDPEGITAPDETHCPYGSWLGIATNAIHNDPENYVAADEYRLFRFSEAQEPAEKERSADELIKRANLSFVSVSTKYHPFGYGRHACPGRFFAANELKLLLAYMVLNYDFEMLENRPECKWYGEVLLPPTKAMIRIRRKTASV